jgi:two-component system cell cycle sensor histidine kinase/response regulator CckA
MLNIAALVFFVLAILAASYPAFRAGPRDGPAILLLVGLAGVAFLGIFAFATSEPRTAPVDEGLHALVDALAEPAAVTTADGRLVSFNAAWRAEAGVLRRLPKDGADGQAIYAALAAARRSGSGEAKLGWRPNHPAAVSRLGDDKLLVRLTRDEPPPPPIPPVRPPVAALDARPAPLQPSPAAAPTDMGPSTLDAFAAAAPFGAALLEGADPFDAAIVEVNEAMTALTGGRAKLGVIFGQLIEPQSRADARTRLNLRRAGPIAAGRPPLCHRSGKRRGGLFARCVRAEAARNPARPGAEDASDRPAGRRRRARFQQSPDGHPASSGRASASSSRRRSFL